MKHLLEGYEEIESEMGNRGPVHQESKKAIEIEESIIYHSFPSLRCCSFPSHARLPLARVEFQSSSGVCKVCRFRGFVRAETPWTSPSRKMLNLSLFFLPDYREGRRGETHQGKWTKEPPALLRTKRQERDVNKAKNRR